MVLAKLTLVMLSILLQAPIKGETLVANVSRSNDKIDPLWPMARSFKAPDPSKIEFDSPEMEDFGRALFFDPQLSLNHQVSCASCHQPERLFTDGLPLAIGLKKGKRNTPTIVNSRWFRWFFWDGRADSLEAQALGPIENHLEQGSHRLYVYDLIGRRYKSKYEQLFGILEPIKFRRKDKLSNDLLVVAQPMTSTSDLHRKRNQEDWSRLFRELDYQKKLKVNQAFVNIGTAIASYERSIIALDSHFDRFLDRWDGNGTPEQYTNANFNLNALNGLRLFVGKAQCHNCHNGPFFTDHQFYNTGLPAYGGPIDLGRSEGLKSWSQSEFSCDSPMMRSVKNISNSETCAESRFLKLDSREWQGAFRTPSLRNLDKTAPYGHKGQISNLKDMIRHYNNGKFLAPVGHPNPLVMPLSLSKKEENDLLVFLKSLNSVSFYSNRDKQPRPSR